MKNDPRERIETKRIRCAGTPDGWSLGQVGTAYAALADWPEVVAFAEAILAANESWLDSQTPTLEELRARYNGKWHLSVRRHGLCFEAEIMPHGSVSNPTYCDGFDTEKQAIRWLVDVIEDRGAFA